MTVAHSIQTAYQAPAIDHTKKLRRGACSDWPDILTAIYQEDVNIAIWKRDLSANLNASVHTFLTENPKFQASMTVSPQTALASIGEALGHSGPFDLIENIAELVDMFCCLFELNRTGLRLTALDRAMCPKFHVDRVPCRLVTTYQGAATEWLPHQRVDRTQLGSGNQKALYNSANDIQQLNKGDVALLKGELWEGNENAGLVHRSPALRAGEHRLLLTLDFSY